MPAGPANALAAVVELAKQVRHGTLPLLDAAGDKLLTWSPPGLSNHILWHAGHALWLQDALSIQPLVGLSELPRGWARIFGQSSRPEQTTDWPEAAEVRVRLERQLNGILDVLDEQAEAIVRNPNAVPRGGGWPLLAGMVHGWHDEARHQGEMYLLHKLYRAGQR